MRQVLSTALVALIVAALTAVTVSAVARSPAAPPLSPAALNADTVDRLSAVKATNNKTARKGRLVATDAKGFLPSNILKPKWGLITGRPAVLADGQIGWNEVQGIPAGFADGTDDVGYVSLLQSGSYDIAPFGPGLVLVDTTLDTDVEVTIIPTAGSAGAEVELRSTQFTRGPETYGGSYPDLPAGMLRHWYEIYNDSPNPTSLRIRTRVYNTGIAPASFRKALKKVKVSVVKVPKKRR